MKALVGSWDHRPYRLLAEIAALRARVGELQQALCATQEECEALREENAALRAAAELERQVVLSS